MFLRVFLLQKNIPSKVIMHLASLVEYEATHVFQNNYLFYLKQIWVR